MGVPDPTVEDVLAVHGDIVTDYGLQEGTAGPAAERRLQSKLAEATEHEPGYDRAAFYLRSIARMHTFEDGNKPTAWMVATVTSPAVGWPSRRHTSMRRR